MIVLIFIAYIFEFQNEHRIVKFQMPPRKHVFEPLYYSPDTTSYIVGLGRQSLPLPVYEGTMTETLRIPHPAVFTRDEKWLVVDA